MSCYRVGCCFVRSTAKPVEKSQPKAAYSISEHSSPLQSEDDPKSMTKVTQTFHEQFEAFKEIQHVDFVIPPGFRVTNEKMGSRSKSFNL